MLKTGSKRTEERLGVNLGLRNFNLKRSFIFLKQRTKLRSTEEFLMPTTPLLHFFLHYSAPTCSLFMYCTFAKAGGWVKRCTVLLYYQKFFCSRFNILILALHRSEPTGNDDMVLCFVSQISAYQATRVFCLPVGFTLYSVRGEKYFCLPVGFSLYSVRGENYDLSKWPSGGLFVRK